MTTTAIECSQFFKDEYERCETSPEYWEAGMIAEVTDVLYARMLLNKMSMTDLANKMGVSRQNVSAFFAGKNSPTLATIAKMGVALGMRPAVRLINEPKKVFKAIDRVEK